jgi:hypothetical protein
MATGVTERKGFNDARNLECGSQAWTIDGLSVREGKFSFALAIRI